MIHEVASVHTRVTINIKFRLSKVRLVIILYCVKIRRGHIFEERNTVNHDVSILKRETVTGEIRIRRSVSKKERLDGMVERRNIEFVVSTRLSSVIRDALERKLYALCLCDDKIECAVQQ